MNTPKYRSGIIGAAGMGCAMMCAITMAASTSSIWYAKPKTSPVSWLAASQDSSSPSAVSPGSREELASHIEALRDILGGQGKSSEFTMYSAGLGLLIFEFERETGQLDTVGRLAQLTVLSQAMALRDRLDKEEVGMLYREAAEDALHKLREMSLLPPDDAELGDEALNRIAALTPEDRRFIAAALRFHAESLAYVENLHEAKSAFAYAIRIIEKMPAWLVSDLPMAYWPDELRRLHAASMLRLGETGNAVDQIAVISSGAITARSSASFHIGLLWSAPVGSLDYTEPAERANAFWKAFRDPRFREDSQFVTVAAHAAQAVNSGLLNGDSAEFAREYLLELKRTGLTLSDFTKYDKSLRPGKDGDDSGWSAWPWTAYFVPEIVSISKHDATMRAEVISWAEHYLKICQDHPTAPSVYLDYVDLVSKGNNK